MTEAPSALYKSLFTALRSSGRTGAATAMASGGLILWAGLLLASEQISVAAVLLALVSAAVLAFIWARRRPAPCWR